MAAVTLRRRNHPFQFSDPVTGRKVRARFIAPLQEIEDCLTAWEIVGTTESKRAERREDIALAATA